MLVGVRCAYYNCYLRIGRIFAKLFRKLLAAFPG